MWKGYFCLFLSLSELQLHVYNIQVSFLSAHFPENGTELVSLLSAPVLTKPKSIHHRSLNYRKCSFQHCTLILKFSCSYTFLAGDTHVIFFCFKFLASAHFCSWFIHCPKILAKGFIFYFIYIWSWDFFLQESLLLPADSWACGTISIFKPVASLFDLVFPLCNFFEHLHASPPHGCKKCVLSQFARADFWVVLLCVLV